VLQELAKQRRWPVYSIAKQKPLSATRLSTFFLSGQSGPPTNPSSTRPYCGPTSSSRGAGITIVTKFFVPLRLVLQGSLMVVDEAHMFRSAQSRTCVLSMC
jgi:hypothetical protein